MPVNDLGQWDGPFDSAWRSRIPPGWIQFADGTIGPPNPASPFDAGWPSRGPAPPYRPGLPALPQQPGPPIQLPGAASPPGPVAGPGQGPPLAIRGGLPARGQATPGPLAEGGAQIFGPQGSNAGTGKELGAWTNPFADGQTIDPSALGGGGGFNLWSLLNPLGRLGMAAGGIMQTSPAETGELPLMLSGARPQHPGSTGRVPGATVDRGTPSQRTIVAPLQAPSRTPQGPAGGASGAWDAPRMGGASGGWDAAGSDPFQGTPNLGGGVSQTTTFGGPPGPLASPDAPMPPVRQRTPAAASNARPAPKPASRPPADLGGTYAPMTGVGQGFAGRQASQFMPYTDPNDPRRYRGPLSMFGR